MYSEKIILQNVINIQFVSENLFWNVFYVFEKFYSKNLVPKNLFCFKRFVLEYILEKLFR